MPRYDYDLFVIGGGSGGVRAARMSAAYGARVAIAEQRHWGGTCVNVGCVPKKLFAYAAHVSEEFRDARRFGWRLDGADFDWATLRDNKTAEIQRLNGIYRQLLGEAGCELLEGRARIVGPHEIAFEGRRIRAANILVAVGGWPHVPAIPGREHVITSNECFFLDRLPERIVIVGGGYVAVEFAGIFHGLGVEVTLCYRGPCFLRGFDDDVRHHLAREMAAKGIDLRFDCRVAAVEKNGPGLAVVLEGGDRIATDMALSATGRRPATRDLGLEQAGVTVNDDGTVPVDERFRTDVPSILALGDVLGRVELTPVAIAEAMALAATLFGTGPVAMDYANVPHAVFAQPPIASVGLSEAEARAAHGDDVDVYISAFRPLKHTVSLNRERTLMKLVAVRSSDRVIGAHMVGPEAGETIQGFAVALKAGATKAIFDATVGIHPTSAEEFVTMRTPVRRAGVEAAP